MRAHPVLLSSRMADFDVVRRHKILHHGLACKYIIMSLLIDCVHCVEIFPVFKLYLPADFDTCFQKRCTNSYFIFIPENLRQ